MKCLVCSSEEVTYIETVMNDEDIGYEVYTCTDCKSRSEYGIEIKIVDYTGENNVFPAE